MNFFARKQRQLQPALHGSELRIYNDIRSTLIHRAAESSTLLASLGPDKLPESDRGSAQILLSMLTRLLASPMAVECLWSDKQDALRFVNTTVDQINTVRSKINVPLILCYTSFANR